MKFDQKTIQKLNALNLVANRVRAGRMRGDRRSSKRGASIEFADYRNYTPGDDIRRLDWNIYARLEKPFIKLFEDEEDLALHILLDISRSMDWGEGSLHKFDYARLVAAGLGAIALSNGDRLDTRTLEARSAQPVFGPARGKHQQMQFFAFLEGLAASQEVRLAEALTYFASQHPRPGLTFILSDLMDDSGFESGLDRILGNGDEIVLRHLLSPDEISPVLNGDLKLIDREYGYTQEVTVDSALKDSYERQFLTWTGNIRDFCLRRGIHYVRTSTALPWDRFILQQLRAEGVVK